MGGIDQAFFAGLPPLNKKFLKKAMGKVQQSKQVKIEMQIQKADERLKKLKASATL